MAGWSFRRRRGPEENTVRQPAAVDSVLAWEITLSLPSSDEILRFEAHFAIEAKWQGDEPPPSLPDIAREGIAYRAERLSRRHTLTAAERLRGALSVALCQWLPVRGTEALARGHCVSVDADTELIAAVAAREEAASRRFAFSWQDERRAHQAEQMRSQLLDPLRATAWWLMENQDKPERVVEIARAFKDARDALAPEDLPDSPGRIFDGMMAVPDPAAKAYQLGILRKLISESGREDLRARLAEYEENAREP
ncbi:hypothetical protein JOF56_010286 [Kibdelosporangium banguiense]|uniref:Uncharacterized protein n=1 Tax=Kibdelosporangium banguiense TaxID=1365924 RepID=A0ABS4TZU5_9PSEU|nr:hypothetical protein [Kibdelosporangium banguiense]MBP2329901.1 hypothetical protein [Kibdelosporangium banguiense]